jgi:hypothetical protein
MYTNNSLVWWAVPLIMSAGICIYIVHIIFFYHKLKYFSNDSIDGIEDTYK